MKPGGIIVQASSSRVWLYEGETITDQHGHIRAKVFGGRLVWYSGWLVALRSLWAARDHPTTRRSR